MSSWGVRAEALQSGEYNFSVHELRDCRIIRYFVRGAFLAQLGGGFLRGFGRSIY